MFKDLFLILFRPRSTIDKLLFENSTRRSWTGTWGLFLLTTLGILVYTVILLSDMLVNKHLPEKLHGAPAGEIVAIMLVLWLGMSLLVMGMLSLMRILFAWFVRMGLRISAGKQYPTDPQERREKGKMLQLIHPYTLAIQTWFSIILSTGMALVFGSMLIDSQEMANKMVAGQLIAFILLYIIVFFVSIGSVIYMIVVRTIAIKKIYNISGSQAFWGPFLIYFLFTVIPYILLIVIGIVVGIMNASATQSFQ